MVKRALLRLHTLLKLVGLDFSKTLLSARGLRWYCRDLKCLSAQERGGSKRFLLAALYPCLCDKQGASGEACGSYFHQDLLVARRIFLNHPAKHVDVGSRIDGFVAHVASFRSVEVFDIRPLDVSIPNIRFVRADLMTPLERSLVESCESLSCLHALEHFGLGRYGDPLNYDGDLIGFKNLTQLLKKGGKFYFSVPIGPQRIEFNAHRIYSVGYLLGLFEGTYQVDQFSVVDDNGALRENVPLTEDDVRSNFGCVHGCGIFELTKVV